jgi:hypothetical protein
MEVVKYTEPSDALLLSMSKSFHIIFTKYCNSLQYINDSYADPKGITSVLIRLDQRKLYFQVFHDMDKGMLEYKQLANLCYWLLKYRPISCTLKEGTIDKANEYFIERFCIYLLDALCYKLLKKGVNLSERNRIELEYSLKHTDVSKEALTVIFGLIIDASK